MDNRGLICTDNGSLNGMSPTIICQILFRRNLGQVEGNIIWESNFSYQIQHSTLEPSWIGYLIIIQGIWKLQRITVYQPSLLAERVLNVLDVVLQISHAVCFRGPLILTDAILTGTAQVFTVAVSIMGYPDVYS